MSEDMHPAGRILIETWGRFACFSRPELKTERVSYDAITPSAARGLLESIYWHPGMRYAVEKIHVLNPIRTMNFRRNEVKSKLSARKAYAAARSNSVDDLWLASSDDIVQRAALLLRDVRYIIEASFFLVPEQMNASDSAAKFQDIMERRVAKGQCYSQPYFGCREFPAHFRHPSSEKTKEIPEELRGERDLGYMLWDIDFSDANHISPLFFHARMKNGVIDVPLPGSREVIA